VRYVERSDDRVLSLDKLTARFEEWILGQIPEVKANRLLSGYKMYGSLLSSDWERL
jgi:hypothetical protein